MIRALSPDQIRLLRLRSQRLHPEAARSVLDAAQLVREVCALQAQELSAATLGVRARSHNLLAGDVKRAREVDRSIVLTWCMRSTLHLVAADDLGWLLPLLGPIFIHKGERRYKQLGLDQETRRQAAKQMRQALSQRGPLTRPEIARILAENIPVEGQAIAHLVGFAALEGTICFGPERDGALTYVVLEDWIRLGRRLDEDKAAAELARRYLEAYGPATHADFATWSGLPASQARAGFEAISKDLLEVKLADSTAWMLKRHADWMAEPASELSVRLLPRFDAYLLGYQRRAFTVSAAHARRIHPGGGQIHATLLVDGRAAGVWRSESKKNSTTILVEPFEPLDVSTLPFLEAEVQDIGRFLGRETKLLTL